MRLRLQRVKVRACESRASDNPEQDFTMPALSPSESLRAFTSGAGTRLTAVSDIGQSFPTVGRHHLKCTVSAKFLSPIGIKPVAVPAGSLDCLAR